MIPLIRSITELIVTTASRDQEEYKLKTKNDNLVKITNQYNDQYRESNHKKEIRLPSLPNIKRQKWKKGKEAVSKFFDELDYNNQIQSSYELTLLNRHNDYENHNAA